MNKRSELDGLRLKADGLQLQLNEEQSKRLEALGYVTDAQGTIAQLRADLATVTAERDELLANCGRYSSAHADMTVQLRSTRAELAEVRLELDNVRVDMLAQLRHRENELAELQKRLLSERVKRVSAEAQLAQVRASIDRVMAEDDEESGAIGLAEELDGIVPAAAPALSPGVPEPSAEQLRHIDTDNPVGVNRLPMSQTHKPLTKD